ncbi:MAG: helicase-associated domain-containing protein, partial [Gemmataceae bacterium]
AMLRLTRASIVKAVMTGLSAEEILERLQHHGSTPLPSNVVHEVREWAGWVRSVPAAPAMLFRCPDAHTADRVLAALGRNAEKLNETTVAFSSAALSETDRRKLREQGIIV